MREESRIESRIAQVLIALGVVFYLFLFPHSIGGDGYIRYEALLTLLEKGKITPMLYSYVGPLISAPLHYLGYLIKNPFWWLSRFNTFVFLGSAFALWRFFHAEWSARQGRLFLLLLFCASMFPKHITDYYSEVFCTCAMALAIALFLTRRFYSGAILLCLSVWNGPGTCIAGALVLAFFSWRERRWRYVLLLLPLLAGLLAENFLKFGSVFPHAYLSATPGGPRIILPYAGGPGFSYPLFFGVLSVIFSFGKGLIFFTPGLLAIFYGKVFRGRAGLFLQAGLFYIVGLILVYSRWWAWSGDVYWGPRFYLFASLWAPVALTALWPYLKESASYLYYWVFATGLSIWVGCESVLYGRDFQEACLHPDLDLGFICQYVPEFSALWRVFVVWPIPTGRKIAYLVYFLLVFVAVMARPTVWAIKLAVRWLRPEVERLLRLREWKM